MRTECNEKLLRVSTPGESSRGSGFNRGPITSDGGALLLRELEAKRRIIGQFAKCFVDHRKPELIEHTVEKLVGQRLYGLALGYEDLNDHDRLRQTRCWRCWWGKRSDGQDRTRSKIAARRWQARAR